MLSYRLDTVNDFHWEFKPVLSYSKLHTFSTILEKKKKEKMHLLYRWEYIVCISTLFNTLVSTEIFALTFMRLFIILKCTNKTCSEKLICQIK